MNPGKDKLGNQGFSLFEIMIAFTLFAIFVLAFVSAQSHNVETSVRLKEELTLQKLAEEIINDIIIDPPQFKEDLTLVPEKKAFKDEGFTQYEYEIEYRRLEIPDFSLLQQAQGEEGQSIDPIEKKVYQEMKKFIKDAIWQVIVTITNTETGFNYSLSAWLSNQEAKVQVKF